MNRLRFRRVTCGITKMHWRRRHHTPDTNEKGILMWRLKTMKAWTQTKEFKRESFLQKKEKETKGLPKKKSVTHDIQLQGIDGNKNKNWGFSEKKEFCLDCNIETLPKLPACPTEVRLKTTSCPSFQPVGLPHRHQTQDCNTDSCFSFQPVGLPYTFQICHLQQLHEPIP